MIQQQMNILDILSDEKKYVRRITAMDAIPFLLNVHYARRIPCITDAFGLFVDGRLIGVVTYGIPASNNLCFGLAGKENVDKVKELNRLVIIPEFNGKNYASYLVSHSLRMLENGTFVVSYADTAWSHVGYVYQACNFLYTGLSAQRTDVMVADGKHPRHTEGLDKNFRQTRSRKHRYVYLVGDKRTKKRMRQQLKYEVINKYPKGDEVHYDPDSPKAVNPITYYEREEENNE